MRGGSPLDTANLSRTYARKKESPSISRGAFRFETALNYGAPGLGACPLTPQVAPGPNGGFHVGAAAGDLSQYMRVENESVPPCWVFAAARFAAFTDFSVTEYWKRRGTLLCVAAEPG